MNFTGQGSRHLGKAKGDDQEKVSKVERVLAMQTVQTWKCAVS